MRRGILFAFLCSTSPVIAGDPATTTLTMPPLPLHAATSTSSGININPFCEPVKTEISGPIQLASGGDRAAVRLLPIGTAIGLHSVKSDEPRRVEQTAMTIETPAQSAVQSNPLIGSKHHVDRNLVDAQVVDKIATAPLATGDDFTHAPLTHAPVTEVPVTEVPVAEIKRRTSSIVLVPSEPVFIDQASHQSNDSSESQIIAAGPTASLEWSRPLAEPSVATQPAEAEQVDAPIEFSFSDNSPTVLPESEIAESENVVEDADSEESALAYLAPIVISEDVADIETDSDLTAMEVAAEPIEPIVKLEPRNTVHVAPASTPEPTLYNKRYRAPVAVTPVPISFGRSDEGSSVHVSTAIEPMAVTNLGDDFMSGMQPDGEATPLYLSRAQVRSLTIGGEVRGVKVNDKSVCQAFAAGPNQLKLIGTGNGVTQLVVWATTGASESAPQMRAFEIHVGEAVDANGDDAPDRTAMLNQSIGRAFPDADVVVHNRHNELIVAGRCSSEATAKKIVRMVRKTCLVPVRDELVVR